MTPKEFILAYEGYSMMAERDYDINLQIMKVIRAIGFGIMKSNGVKKIKDEMSFLPLPKDVKWVKKFDLTEEQIKDRLGRTIKDYNGK